jgi:predicted short-subunit dehydrogenase-like oxidoreductase (DUF2520 family)
MAIQTIRKVILIGAGKLATNIGIALKNNGYSIIQVYNRTPAPGLQLAQTISSEIIDDLPLLSNEADLYCIAVSDSAVELVVNQIRLKDQMVIHFSGTLGLGILDSCTSNYGVIYPPQTFTKQSFIDFRDLPLCIEANNLDNQQKLIVFAGTLSSNVLPVTFIQRKTLHLASVLAGNFPNFLYSISENLLKDHNLPLELIVPLIEKTASNAREGNIFDRQTGPAIREDHEVINIHLDLLSKSPGYREIYRMMTESIIQQKNKK